MCQHSVLLLLNWFSSVIVYRINLLPLLIILLSCLSSILITVQCYNFTSALSTLLPKITHHTCGHTNLSTLVHSHKHTHAHTPVYMPLHSNTQAKVR